MPSMKTLCMDFRIPHNSYVLIGFFFSPMNLLKFPQVYWKNVSTIKFPRRFCGYLCFFLPLCLLDSWTCISLSQPDVNMQGRRGGPISAAAEGEAGCARGSWSQVLIGLTLCLGDSPTAEQVFKNSPGSGSVDATQTARVNLDGWQGMWLLSFPSFLPIKDGSLRTRPWRLQAGFCSQWQIMTESWY